MSERDEKISEARKVAKNLREDRGWTPKELISAILTLDALLAQGEATVIECPGEAPSVVVYPQPKPKDGEREPTDNSGRPWMDMDARVQSPDQWCPECRKALRLPPLETSTLCLSHALRYINNLEITLKSQIDITNAVRDRAEKAEARYIEALATKPQPKDGERFKAWAKCRAERDGTEGASKWTLGEVITYSGFFNLGYAAAEAAQPQPVQASGWSNINDKKPDAGQLCIVARPGKVLGFAQWGSKDHPFPAYWMIPGIQYAAIYPDPPALWMPSPPVPDEPTTRSCDNCRHRQHGKVFPCALGNTSMSDHCARHGFYRWEAETK